MTLKTKEKILERLEKSELMKRISALESFWWAHGGAEYHGQTIQDFLSHALNEVEEETAKERLEEIKNRILLALKWQGIDVKQGKFFVEKEYLPTVEAFTDITLHTPKLDTIGSNNNWIGFLGHLLSTPYALQEKKGEE